MFERKFLAGWGDMDFNSHMRNTAYLDKSADLRMMFFAENAFPMGKFVELRFGPVVMKDEVEYFREIGLLESITVSLAIAMLSEDGSRYRMRNEFARHDGKRAACVNSDGGWLDLNTRRLMAPPAELLVALRNLPRTSDFVVAASALKA